MDDGFFMAIKITPLTLLSFLAYILSSLAETPSHIQLCQNYMQLFGRSDGYSGEGPMRLPASSSMIQQASP